MLHWMQLVLILHEAVASNVEKSPRSANERSPTDIILIEFPYSRADRAKSTDQNLQIKCFRSYLRA